MPPLLIPPVLAWTLGAVGATALAKVLAKEWRRINAELDARERAAVAEPARDSLPTLRRDASGVFRPE